jgi:hypothetical protein
VDIKANFSTISQKVRIPVTLETINGVEKCDLESVHILLSVLYHFYQARNLSPAKIPIRVAAMEPKPLPKERPLSMNLVALQKSDEDQQAESSNFSPSDKDTVVKSNPRAVSLLCEPEEETFSGKMASLKLICNLLGAQEPSPGVRYAQLPGVARELIKERLETMPFNELEGISSLLIKKV